MPLPHQATLDFFRGKTSAPSELRTAEWDRVPREIRERAFFMAAVEDAEILDRFRAGVESIVAGEKSESEVMAELHDDLKARGYAPLPGQEGTIKDLRSIARMRVALRTNVEAARSYGQWRRQQQALAAFPATRYQRGRQAEVPRDWPARWNAARAATAEAGATEATGEHDMVALANHPLWTDPEFNRLGSPWPPFDFGSGMMTLPVPRAEAVALGLIPDKDATGEEADFLRELLKPADRSFNESLQARPAVASQPLRDALAERLRGLAEWEGPVLRFTDPNGTRPGTAAEVARWITAPLPVDPATKRPFPRLQAAALAKWAEDHELFSKEGRKKSIPWDRDLVADLLRSVRRVRPYRGGPVWRGMSWRDEAGWKSFLNAVKKEGYAPLDTKLLDSFSVAESGARKYASRGEYRAILEVAAPKSAREIAPQVRALVREGLLRSPDPAMPLPTDGEAVYIRGAKFRVAKITKISAREVKILLGEVAP